MMAMNYEVILQMQKTKSEKIYLHKELFDKLRNKKDKYKEKERWTHN